MPRATTLPLESPAFADGEVIPSKHTGDGHDLSPELRWGEMPPGTKELALIMDDPDSPTPEPWVHWLLYKIPPGTRRLPEGIPAHERLDDPPELRGALHGKNSWGAIGYRGPTPPRGHGAHRYHFKLYALSAPLDLGPGADKTALELAMAGLVIAKAELTGTYER